MININNLCHSLGGEKILENICLSIPDGTILGLVGVNGAGKSTLLRLISGVYLPDEGSIDIDGLSPCLEATRKELFFLPDDPYFTHQATIKSVFEMYKTFFDIDIEVYERLMKTFELEESKPLRTFSKGMKRQAYIVMALAIRPKYLLLDEAFDGLDPLARKLVKDELIKIVENHGATIIISSHSLREIEDFCDMYAIIDKKSISSSGDISQMVDCYCKFMLAFDKELPENAFNALPVVSITKSDKFVKGIFKGDANEIEKLLIAMSPAVIEQLPISFEDVFINEVSRRDKNDEL